MLFWKKGRDSSDSLLLVDHAHANSMLYCQYEGTQDRITSQDSCPRGFS